MTIDAGEDAEHRLTRAELAALRGPYVRRPAAGADPEEWMRWAEEVEAAMPLAAEIMAIIERVRAARAAARRGRLQGHAPNASI